MAQPRNRNKNLLMAVGAAVVVAVAVVALFGGSGGSGGSGGGGGGFAPSPDFDAGAVRAQIEDMDDRGNSHVSNAIDYGDEFPTSGPHASSWLPPGFYDGEQLVITEMLVHSMEHGYVVIFFDEPGAEAVEQIRQWTLRYQGEWDGIVATAHPGLGREVVLTAWTKRLRLPEFSADAAWIFVDDYRGRGPENAVR